MFRVVRVILYFILYAFIRSFLFYLLSVVEVRSYYSLLKGIRGVRVKQLLLLSLLLITLAGLPPTVGFSMKWAIVSVVALHRMVGVGLLLVGSVLRLYYYSCLRFCWYGFSSSKVWELAGVVINKVFGCVVVRFRLICGFLRFLVVRLVCV